MFAKGAEPTNLAAGQSLYEVFDANGDYTGAILIAAGQPLPETVKTAIAARIAPVVSENSGDLFAAMSRIDGISGTVDKSTGRHVIVVYWTVGGPTGTVWLTSNHPLNYEGTTPAVTSDEMVGRAQKWIAKQSDPASYEILVISQ